jgi:hypothetical protein
MGIRVRRGVMRRGGFARMASPKDGYVTTAEAGALLGLTPAAVRRAIAEGRMQAEKIAPRLTLVSLVEVEKYRRERLGRRQQARQHDE